MTKGSGPRVVAGDGGGSVAWDPLGRWPGCSSTRPVGTSRSTRDSRAQRAGCSSPSGALSRFACRRGTTVSHPAVPGATSDTAARKATSRAPLSLLRTSTSTSDPSARSGASLRGCSAPPVTRHTAPSAQTCQAACPRCSPGARSQTSADFAQASATSAWDSGSSTPGACHSLPVARVAEDVIEDVPVTRQPAPPPGVVARPPRGDLALMAVGLAAVSTSGPLMAATVAPALAVAMWRNAFALVAITPVALATRLDELRGLTARERRWALGAGVLLAGHFATWVPSLRFTSVASATAIVCTQPVWVALIARASGHDVPRRTWVGITIALVAVVVLTGVDFSLEPRALWGDLLALLGGVFAAFYTVAGGEVRRSVSTTTYTLICYSTAGVVLLAVCLVAGVELVGYDGRTWLQLLALTAGAQL